VIANKKREKDWGKSCGVKVWGRQFHQEEDELPENQAAVVKETLKKKGGGSGGGRGGYASHQNLAE